MIWIVPVSNPLGFYSLSRQSLHLHNLRNRQLFADFQKLSLAQDCPNFRMFPELKDLFNIHYCMKRQFLCIAVSSDSLMFKKRHYPLFLCYSCIFLCRSDYIIIQVIKINIIKSLLNSIFFTLFTTIIHKIFKLGQLPFRIRLILLAFAIVVAPSI